MITCRNGLKTVLGVMWLALAVACDAGSPSKSADEIAADSALAADLALANRDTLLVDSIGAYRPADREDEALTDDTAIISADAGPARTADVVASPKIVPPPAPRPTTPEPASTPASTPKAATKPPSAPRLTGTRACNSPTQENQSECVRVSLAAADQRLNRIYRALITEMRRQEGVPSGAKDPASVQRLRIGQRAWLVYRDKECRTRGRGREGALWARPRVRCLGQFSARRANELADNFSRLTAH